MRRYTRQRDGTIYLLLLVLGIAGSACTTPQHTLTRHATPLAVQVPVVGSVRGDLPATDVWVIRVHVGADDESVARYGRGLESKALEIAHCAAASFDGDRLVSYGVSGEGLNAVVWADYQGPTLSRGGDNKLVRFLATGEDVTIPLALDTSVPFYRLANDGGPTLELWVGEAEQEEEATVLTVTYRRPRSEDGTIVTITETHRLQYYTNLPLSVRPGLGCE